MDSLAVLVAAFACWRVTSLLYREEWFDWFRKLFGVEHDENGPAAYHGAVAKVFECFWCLSLVMAIPFAVSVVLLRGWSVGFGALLWLAISAGAILIETRTGHFRTQQ